MHITKEKLQELLSYNNITATARILNTTTHTIYKKMKKYGIRRKKDSGVDMSVIGKKFNKLIVESYHGLDRHNKAKFLCTCDCGNKKIINISSLKRNLTKSCGCDKISKCRKNGYKDISYSYYRRILQSCEERLIFIDISMEDIWSQFEKQNFKCYYSGININFYPDSNKVTKQTASIDRINPEIGYIKSNIVIVHKFDRA
jgi:hypothetical protein